ncbi:hypothetical protein [Rugamonas sp. DEMB1]|uniref:hypothetical protein n=1 Tax=Rugamonas sp. DEMB1 TaxID=3039386 RepID=UPI002447D42B|nr:hypothetical protein [Rugamonas sp. DEMB1]WGG50903.1 hypothetical protein QC826_00900 [Rugamonas sp. DEMB1]
MNHLISLVIILLTGLAVYAILRSGPARPAAPPPRAGGPYIPSLPDTSPVRHWSDGGRFLVEVSSESRYQAAIGELAGEHGAQGASAPYQAVLLPDDHNHYEDKAVAVFMAGRMVGYLAPKDALRFRQRLAAAELAGQPTTCDAMVRGGGDWQGKRLAYVVVLDVEPFE